MKKIVTFLLMVSMVSALFCFNSTSAYAYEENASYTIKANKSVKVDFWGKEYTSIGSESENKEETYEFTVPSSSGYFYYTVTPIKAGRTYADKPDKIYSNFSLNKAEMWVGYKRIEARSYISYGKDPYKSGSYCFKKGTKVKITLYDSLGKGEYSQYKLKLVWKTPSNFEKESNNTKKTSTTLEHRTVTGGVLHQQDTDWWVFKAPTTKTYSIKVVETQTTGSYTLHATVYDKSGKKLAGKYVRNKQGWITVMNQRLVKGQKVYISLENGSKDEFYKILAK